MLEIDVPFLYRHTVEIDGKPEAVLVLDVHRVAIAAPDEDDFPLAARIHVEPGSIPGWPGSEPTIDLRWADRSFHRPSYEVGRDRAPLPPTSAYDLQALVRKGGFHHFSGVQGLGDLLAAKRAARGLARGALPPGFVAAADVPRAGKARATAVAALDDAASRLLVHGDRVFERCGEPCWEIRGGDAVPQIRHQEDISFPENFYRADRLEDRTAAEGRTAGVRGRIEVMMPETLELSMEQGHLRRSLEGTLVLAAGTTLETVAKRPGIVDAYLALKAAMKACPDGVDADLVAAARDALEYFGDRQASWVPGLAAAVRRWDLAQAREAALEVGPAPRV